MLCTCWYVMRATLRITPSWNSVVAHLAPGVELEEHALGQAVLAFDEAADLAREGVWQHRHDGLGEVDRGAAQIGLLVEGRAFPHVVRHVGDMHGEAPVPVGKAIEADGIVVVAGRLGVHGDRRPAAKVGPPPDVLGPHLLGDVRRLRLDLLGEALGQVELRHDDLEVDARVLEPAEHGENAPRGIARGRGRPHDLSRNHLAGVRATLVPWGDEELVQHAAVEGHDVAAVAAVALEAAHHPLQAALEDPDDPPLGALGRHPLDAGHDPVAVQGLLEIDGRHVHVPLSGVALLRHDEAVARRIAGEASDRQVHPRGKAHARAPDLHDLAVFDELAQRRLELLAALARKVESPHQLAHGERLAVRSQQVQYAVSKVQ